ncbi:hypothetical protein D3C81_1203590 [compost metagenome]
MGHVRHFGFRNRPVVERALILELSGAQGVGHALDGVFQRMGKCIHRINAPFIAGVMMRRMHDAVDDRVSQIDVRRGHVDFGAQHLLPVLEFAGAHPFEQVEVLLDRAVAVGAVFTRLGQRPAQLADLVGAEIIHVGFALFDQQHRAFVHLLKIIRRKMQFFPIEAQPFDVFLDRIDILYVFFHRVGVVESQVGASAKLVRQREVDPDRFGMPDM